jgi:hypothetical protein
MTDKEHISFHLSKSTADKIRVYAGRHKVSNSQALEDMLAQKELDSWKEKEQFKTEQTQKRAASRRSYREPKVNWGNSEGTDAEMSNLE